jgi:hypothetical protein
MFNRAAYSYTKKEAVKERRPADENSRDSQK